MQANTVQVGNRQYDLGTTLGVGGFSEVKRGTDINTKRKVALKITYTDATSKSELQTQLRSVQKEIKSMKLLHHVNCIRLLGYDLKCNVGGRSAIVMVQELAPRGELFDYLMFTQKFPQNMGISVFHQLISGLAHVHGQGIAHRDLKPENLLFDNNYNLKIVDFGFSYNFNKNGMKTMMRTELGTKGYMAPEILNGVKYDEKADIFAAGVILFIMLAGFPPFQNAVPNDWWFDKLMKKKYRLFWMAHERTAQFSDESKALIQAMLAPAQADRPSCEEIAQFDFWSANHLDKTELRDELEARKAIVDENKRREHEDSAQQLTAESRDPFTECIIQTVENLPGMQPILMKELVVNPPRDAIRLVEDEEDYAQALETLIETSPKSNLVSKLVEAKLAYSEENLVVLKQLAETSSAEEIAGLLNIELKAAQAIDQTLKLTPTGEIDDYDPVLFSQLAQLDDLELKPFEEHGNFSVHGFKTRASFGLVTYCLITYANLTNAAVDIDSDKHCVDMTFTVEKDLELPVEDEDGNVDFQEASMEVEIKMRVKMYQGEDNQGVLVFTNEGHAYLQEYTYIKDQICNDVRNMLSLLTTGHFKSDDHLLDVVDAETEVFENDENNEFEANLEDEDALFQAIEA